MAKTATRMSRIMRTLRAGDVITNLNCPKHRHHRVLVLARSGGTKFEFSLKAAEDLNIIRDPRGPYHWDDENQTFVNDAGRGYGHIGKDTVVLEGAGREQVEWYRSLPPAQSDRFFINPNNLLGTNADPGTLAKIEALLSREGDEDDGGAQQVRNMGHVLDLIFAGTSALDARRASLLLLVINSQVHAAKADQRESAGIEDLLGSLMSLDAMMGPGGLRFERPRARANGR